MNSLFFKRKISGLLVYVVSLFLAIWCLSYMVQNLKNLEDIENVAILPGTTIIKGKVDGKLVHCHNSKDADLCLDNYWTNSFKRKSIIWLGNSQLHAINQISDTDQPAPSILHSKLIPSKSYLLTFSQANANLQEHFVIFNFLLSQLNFDLLLLPVFFDDLRETGVRDSISNFFASQDLSKINSDHLQLLLKESSGTGIFDDFNDDGVEGKSSFVELEGIKGTPQSAVENYLGNKLSDLSIIWRSQAKLRGYVMISLYKFRNSILGITPSSIRKVIPSRYQKNMLALEESLKLANQRGVQVLVYIPPIRNDYDQPYDPGEYLTFKRHLEKLVTSHNAHFIDLERVIPSKYWGMKDSTSAGDDLEADFMHFQVEGHQILANEIYEKIIPILGKGKGK